MIILKSRCYKCALLISEISSIQSVHMLKDVLISGRKCHIGSEACGLACVENVDNKLYMSKPKIRERMATAGLATC